MTNVVIINTAAHQAVRVRAEVAAELGDARRFVPVVVDEFAHLATFCPIFFAKDSETGAFYCGAMLGFDDGENLFLDAPNPDRFRPLNLKRLPFYTAGDDLAIDLDHPRVGTGAGEPLFDEAGQPSAFLEQVMAHIRRLRPGEVQTKQFIQTLLEHDLIEPVDIDIQFDDGQDLHIDGLYTINKLKLGALPDAVALDLFRRGYLYLAHVMMAALSQVPALIERRNQRDRARRADFQL